MDNQILTFDLNLSSFNWLNQVVTILKTVKLFVCSLLILIAVTIGGDLFQDYLSHFEYSFDSTSMSLPFKVNGEEMTSELLQKAKEHNVCFFTIQRSYYGIYKSTIRIYFSDPAVMKEIEKRCNIKEQTYHSVFFGETIVTTDSFENSSNKLLTGNYYLLGDSNDLLSFKLSLMQKYGGGLIKEGYDPMNDRPLIILSWIIVLIVFSLLNLFEYFINHKQNALLISMGMSPAKLIIKNIAIDVSVILTVYLIIRIITSRFTNPQFYQIYHFIFLLLLILIDIISYLKISRINIQHSLKGSKSQKPLLISCYAAKYIATALTMALIASNLIVIASALSWKSQEDFWDNYGSYNQLSARIVRDDGEFSSYYLSSLDMNYKAYCHFFNKANATIMSVIADEEFFGQTVIAYNKNSTEYLQNILKSIDFSTLKENKVYALLPEKYYMGHFNSSQKEELDRMGNYLIDWDGSYSEGVEIIYYNNNAKLLALERNSDFDCKYYKNPIVLFVNIDEEKNPRINTGDNNIGSNSYFTIYNISSNEFEAFMREDCPKGYNVQVFSSNVQEQYQYKLSIAEKTLFINSFLSILFILLNLIITLVTIRMDYSINAVELSLKKIMGYSLFERHKAIITGSFICLFVSIITATVINSIFDFIKNPLYILLSGILFLTADLAVIAITIKKTEREQVSKILKGGAL